MQPEMCHGWTSVLVTTNNLLFHLLTTTGPLLPDYSKAAVYRIVLTSFNGATVPTTLKTRGNLVCSPCALVAHGCCMLQTTQGMPRVETKCSPSTNIDHLLIRRR